MMESILFSKIFFSIKLVVGDRRHPPHCATCNCLPRYLVPGLDLQKAMNAATNYSNSNTTAANSNNNNNNNKMSFMINEHLLQTRLPVDINTAVNFNAMKTRSFPNTTPNIDEDRDEPTPPKMRISNSLTETLPLTTTSNDSINNCTPQSTRTPPLIITKPFQHNNTLNDDNNDADDCDDDSQSSFEHEKSAIKAAFATQQKEFLIQQQLQQQQQQHLQQQHLQHLYDEEHSFDQPYQRNLQYGDVNAYLQDADHNGSRQRKERMSKRQKELYVEFLEQNPIVNNHRRNDPVLDGFWLRLATILNDCPNGAAKSVAEWKQAFDNWRYRVFLYARHNSQLSGDDAINSKAFKPLTLTDKRAYNLWIRNPDTAPANIEKLPTDLICTED